MTFFSIFFLFINLQLCYYILNYVRYKREIRNKARNKRSGNGPQQFNASKLLPKAGDYSVKVLTRILKIDYIEKNLRNSELWFMKIALLILILFLIKT